MFLPKFVGNKAYNCSESHMNDVLCGLEPATLSCTCSKTSLLGPLGAGGHQAFVECTLVMKRQGRPRTVCHFFSLGVYTVVTMFLIAEGVKLGSSEKFSKVVLLEATALRLNSFEVVLVKMYEGICIRKSKMREKISKIQKNF